MREWVVGFLIDPKNDTVVLIRKRRPPWQNGKLNGVGGKVEEGETPDEAMTREFAEETGVVITAWEPFVHLRAVSTEDRSGQITSEQGIVHFFRAFMPDVYRCGITSRTDEHVAIYPIETIVCHLEAIIPNLLWLIPLAAHQHDTYEPLHVIERSTTLRVP